MEQQKVTGLFDPIRIGELELKNRIVMAPMTRSRALHETHMPTAIMETYYEQRADAGLIISEGVIVSPIANGYLNIPGIYNQEQVIAWKAITNKVHAKGGKIFAQLWHVGRLSHPDLHEGKLPLAPSAINPDFFAFTSEGQKPTVTPQAMSLQDIRDTIADFRNAALNAIQAGFDGIEIHGANAYLFHQFIATSANTRTDAYGGSAENRARFLFEVLDAVISAIGHEKVALRLNPGVDGVAGILLDEDTQSVFDHIIEKLNDYHLAYLHLTGAMMPVLEGQAPYEPIIATAKKYRAVYQGTLMVNNGFDRESGERVIRESIADLVAYGVPFIANPDLVERYQLDLAVAAADTNIFYQGETQGYTDYPFFSATTTSIK